MARADLLLDLVRAGARGDRSLFRKSLEALVTEERAKQHHVLADRLAAHLNAGGLPNASASPSPAHGRPGQALTRRNGGDGGRLHPRRLVVSTGRTARVCAVRIVSLDKTADCTPGASHLTSPPPGEVSERFKEHAWKVCVR